MADPPPPPPPPPTWAFLNSPPKCRQPSELAGVCRDLQIGNPQTGKFPRRGRSHLEHALQSVRRGSRNLCELRRQLKVFEAGDEARIVVMGKQLMIGWRRIEQFQFHLWKKIQAVQPAFDGEAMSIELVSAAATNCRRLSVRVGGGPGDLGLGGLQRIVEGSVLARGTWPGGACGEG